MFLGSIGAMYLLKDKIEEVFKIDPESLKEFYENQMQNAQNM